MEEIGVDFDDNTFKPDNQYRLTMGQLADRFATLNSTPDINRMRGVAQETRGLMDSLNPNIDPSGSNQTFLSSLDSLLKDKFDV